MSQYKNYNKLSELMEWYDKSFDILLTDEEISKIGFIIPSPYFRGKINSEKHSSQNNFIFWYCPCGILLLNAQKNNIEINEYKSPNSRDRTMSPYIKGKWKEKIAINHDIDINKLSKIHDNVVISALIPLLKEC